jgi:hypothetical protein
LGRERIASVAGLMLLVSGFASSRSAQPSSVLSESLCTHVRDERFVGVASIAGLPPAVQDGLKRLFGSPTLQLAEPGAEFQATDVIVKPNLPIRRLIVAGCSADHCLVYYERGGIAHTRYVVLFQLMKTGTRFEWGGSAPDGLADPDEVKAAVLAGAVKGQTRYW